MNRSGLDSAHDSQNLNGVKLKNMNNAFDSSSNMMGSTAEPRHRPSRSHAANNLKQKHDELVGNKGLHGSSGAYSRAEPADDNS